MDNNTEDPAEAELSQPIAWKDQSYKNSFNISNESIGKILND